MDIGREIHDCGLIPESLGHVIEADERLAFRIRPGRKTLPQRPDCPNHIMVHPTVPERIDASVGRGDSGGID